MSLSASQLEMRTRGLGASEIAAVCGLNKWHSPLDVWLEKTGKSEPFKGNMKTRKGDLIEPAVRRWWAEKRGLTNLREPGTLVDAEHQWLLATPDAIGTDAIGDVCGECKHVGERVRHHWPAGQCPEAVEIQSLIQQRVTGIHRGEVAAWIDPGDDPDDERIVVVDWNEEIVASLLEIAGEFWHENVLRDIPPAVDASESWGKYLKRAYPKDRTPLVVAPFEADEWVRKFLEAKAAIGALEATKDEAEHALKLMIGDGAGIVRAGRYRVTWLSDKNGAVSWKKVAEELGAPQELIEKHTGTPARKFLVHGGR